MLLIAPDGSLVKKGQLVCELDSATIRQTVANQRIIVEAAAAASIVLTFFMVRGRRIATDRQHATEKTSCWVASLKDGMSTTLLNSEVVVGQGRDLRGFFLVGDAAAFETFLAPNSSFPDILFSPCYCLDAPPNPPCAGTTTALPDNYAARSRHPGGVNVSMADGSVRFVKNSLHIRTWRALSTTQGEEIVSSDQL